MNTSDTSNNLDTKIFSPIISGLIFLLVGYILNSFLDILANQYSVFGIYTLIATIIFFIITISLLMYSKKYPNSNKNLIQILFNFFTILVLFSSLITFLLFLNNEKIKKVIISEFDINNPFYKKTFSTGIKTNSKSFYLNIEGTDNSFQIELTLIRNNSHKKMEITGLQEANIKNSMYYYAKNGLFRINKEVFENAVIQIKL